MCVCVVFSLATMNQVQNKRINELIRNFMGLPHTTTEKRNREISRKKINNFEAITVLVVPFENYLSGRGHKHQTSHFTVYHTRQQHFPGILSSSVHCYLRWGLTKVFLSVDMAKPYAHSFTYPYFDFKIIVRTSNKLKKLYRA